jgi:hypothetical protein
MWLHSISGEEILKPPTPLFYLTSCAVLLNFSFFSFYLPALVTLIMEDLATDHASSRFSSGHLLLLVMSVSIRLMRSPA